MHFTSDEDPPELFDLDTVRENWSQSENTSSQQILPVTRSVVPAIRWDQEVISHFEKLRVMLSSSFPDYIETFDVLCHSLEDDLNRWMGFAPRQEDPDSKEPEPSGPEPQAGEDFMQGLMELENFLEAIFVDGDFWRLMR